MVLYLEWVCAVDRCLYSLYESMQDGEGDAGYTRHDDEQKLKSMHGELEAMMKKGEVFVKHNAGLKSFSAERYVCWLWWQKWDSKVTRNTIPPFSIGIRWLQVGVYVE